MKKASLQALIVLMIVSLALFGCSSSTGGGTSGDSGGGSTASTGSSSSGGNESTSNGGESGNDGGSGEVIELSYWVPFAGSDGEFMEAMVAAFNESQDEIKVQFMNNDWDNYYPKLNTSLVSNAAPDVAAAHTSQLANLVPTGKLQPIDDLAADAGLDWSDFGANQVEAVQADGQHYAIPLDTHALVMYYNNTYLEEAGLLNDDGTINMEPGAEGFTNMLRTLKQTLPADVTPISLGTNNILTFWIWYALVHQQGGTYMADGEPTIDTPEGRTALELLRTWLDEGLTDPDVGDQHYDIFKNQNAALTFTGVWATGNFETEPSLDFSVAPFPQLYDQAATWGDSHTIIVPVQDDRDKQVAAVKFADWLTTNGAMWSKAGHVPVKPAVLETPEFKQLPYRADYADGVMGEVKYMPSTPKLGGLNDIVLESLVEVNYGIVSVEAGLSKAQESAEQLMNN